MSAETTGMDPLTSDDPPQVGPYQLLGRLGAGGMGQVYLGRGPDGALVAVKTVYPHLARAPEFRRRFQQEVQAARQVSGTHTAAITDADTEAAIPWLATSYVDGPSLAEAVTERGPLTPHAVRALAAGLAEALASVHAAGVIHRDVKPANVLLAADGPRLIDFGIARALDATSITQTGITVGTPGYVCPERLTGGPVGEPADLYALGAVLYFALTGQPPFGTGEPAQLYYRTVHEPPDLSAVTDPVLHRLIADCLAKDPAARPSIADVLRRLANPTIADDGTLAHHSVPAAGTRPYPPMPPNRRPRRRIWLAMAGAVVLIAGVVLAITLPGSGTQSADGTPPSNNSGFPWSLSQGHSGSLVGLWSTANSVVVGTALGGLAGYDPATGKQQWAWPLPDKSILCAMSPSVSFMPNLNQEAVGAFEYGSYTTDGAQRCDHLQTISLPRGKLNWAKAVSLVGPGAPGFPTGDSSALSIDGTLVTAPFAGSADPKSGPGIPDNDILSAFVQDGKVLMSTDYGSNPMPGGCTLSGTARVLGDVPYTVGVCGGQDEVLQMMGAPVAVAPLPGCRPIVSGFVTGFLAVQGNSLVIGCNIERSDTKVYILPLGAHTAIPVDLSGVDASVIGYENGGQQPANMVLTDDTMYLVGGQNDINAPTNSVVAIDMNTGKQKWTATMPGLTTSVRLLAPIGTGVSVVAHGGSGPAAMYTVRTGGTVVKDYSLNAAETQAFRQVDKPQDTPCAVAVGDAVAVGFYRTLNDNDTVLGVLPN